MSVWLGQIVWWNVAMEGRPSRVRLEELRGWVEELGLQVPSMPSPKGAHIFRAASGQLTRRYVDDEGLAAELSTKEVSATADFIVRHVLKTSTDPRSQALRVEKVAQLKFFRPTRTSAGRRAGSEVSRPSLKPGLAGADAAAVLALVEDFRQQYAQRSEYLSMAALRRVVRDFVVIRCDGVLIRPAGGLYFVEDRWADQLGQLVKLIERFGPEAGSHVIPLIDSPSQRAMVSRGLAEAIVDDCRVIVESVTVAGGPTYYTRYRAHNTLLRLQRLRRHYAQLLAIDVGGTPRVLGALEEAQLALGACRPRESQIGGKVHTQRKAEQAQQQGYAPIL